MEIIVNGETRQIHDDACLSDLLKDLDLADKKVAIEVNMDIVPRSTYADHRLSDGDRIEIVRAIGGG